MNLPSVAQLKGIWRQRLGTAKATWGILINDDRLISQARYAFSRDEADAQVQSVLAKSRS